MSTPMFPGNADESMSTLSNQLIEFYVDDPVLVNGESGKPRPATVVGVSGKQHVTGQYKLTNSTGEPLQAGDTVPASYFEGAKNDKIIYSPTPAIGANGGNGHIISVNPDGTYAIALDADGQVLDNIIPAEIAIIIDTSNPPKPKILSNIPRANLRLDFAALPNERDNGDHPETIGGMPTLPWEKQGLNMIKRDTWDWILWIFDPEGRNGKNLFGEHVVKNENAVRVEAQNIKVDKKKIVEKIESDDDFDGTVIVELVRNDQRLKQPGKKLALVETLEKLQDFTYTRDEDGGVEIKLKVIVLCNHETPGQMSRGRFKLYLLDSKKALMYSNMLEKKENEAAVDMKGKVKIEEQYQHHCIDKEITLFKMIVLATGDDAVPTEPCVLGYREMLHMLTTAGKQYDIDFFEQFRVNEKRSHFQGAKTWHKKKFIEWVGTHFPTLAATGKKDEEKTYKFTGCKRKRADTGSSSKDNGSCSGGETTTPQKEKGAAAAATPATAPSGGK